MSKYTLNQADLRMFTGTEHWYRHPIVRKVLYTDGVQHVAEAGGAYWLLDEIAFAQHEPSVSAEPFQRWTLSVHADQTACLECEDGNSYSVYRKGIEFTDFPLSEVTFYFTNQVLMLPSEY
jgi:hypothetical protein